MRVDDATELARLRQLAAERERQVHALRDRCQQLEADIYQRAQEIHRVNEKLRQANAETSRLYDKTLELERLKTQYFAAASHALHTPVSLILGAAQRLLADPPAGGDAQRQLAVIERNTRTLLRHVNELLDMSRLDAGRLQIAYARTDVARLLRFIAGHFDALADERRIDFAVQAPPQLCAEVDPDKLARVLLNLLSNAFRFAPAGGQVRATVHVPRERVVFEVADSGPGVPADIRHAVFDHFAPPEVAALRRPATGTGLGLPIAYDFVALHGGLIDVTDAPGGGALFVVELPRQAPRGVPVATETPGEWSSLDIAGQVADVRRASAEAARKPR